MTVFSDIFGSLSFSEFLILIFLIALFALVLFLYGSKDAKQTKTINVQPKNDEVDTIVNENKNMIRNFKDNPDEDYNENLFNDFTKVDSDFKEKTENDFFDTNIEEEKDLSFEKKALYKKRVSEYYKEKGYKVLDDELNIDLVCTKKKKTVLIYCKDYPEKNAIHLKHIKRFLNNAKNYADRENIKIDDIKLFIAVPSEDLLTENASNGLKQSDCKTKIKIIKA